ncbi:EthD family reductase [Bryobacter aggregatus]|uniref:EthD family reductase n=1 Tax=Bryobacter aggregatus TaxID=360054 RepID=UPI0004E22668|nr:EthD family reductase [Bryobacter aggregatus]
MICVTAFYPAAGEGRFDTVYYYDRHLPMVSRLLQPFGLQKIEVDEGVSGFAAGMPPNYRFICRLYFDRLEGFQAGIAAVGNQILGDVGNYTDIPVELQVSQTRTL